MSVRLNYNLLWTQKVIIENMAVPIKTVESNGPTINKEKKIHSDDRLAMMGSARNQLDLKLENYKFE